jgi:hypothetical protein
MDRGRRLLSRVFATILDIGYAYLEPIQTCTGVPSGSSTGEDDKETQGRCSG